MKQLKRAGRSVDEETRRYLTRGEVARLFEVSPATVARWAREGRLPHVSTLGGHRRYRVQEVLAIVENTTRPRAPNKNKRRVPP
jgi:excisionase family DNA binding protein